MRRQLCRRQGLQLRRTQRGSENRDGAWTLRAAISERRQFLLSSHARHVSPIAEGQLRIVSCSRRGPCRRQNGSFMGACPRKISMGGSNKHALSRKVCVASLLRLASRSFQLLSRPRHECPKSRSGQRPTVFFPLRPPDLHSLLCYSHQ